MCTDENTSEISPLLYRIHQPRVVSFQPPPLGMGGGLGPWRPGCSHQSGVSLVVRDDCKGEALPLRSCCIFL